MTGHVVQLAQPNTVRLLTNADRKELSLAPLFDGEDEFRQIVSLEYATHGRLSVQQVGLPALDPKELVYGVAHATFINAAFCYPRPGGNRFNDETRGAWYCGFDVETSLAEVEYHLTRALQDTGKFENSTDYVELYADFIGTFHDLRGVKPSPKCLDPNIQKGYPAGQELARELRAQGVVSGIVYPSVRYAPGTCLVAFIPAAVQNVRRGSLWRLTWSGFSKPAIHKNPTT